MSNYLNNSSTQLLIFIIVLVLVWFFFVKEEPFRNNPSFARNIKNKTCTADNTLKTSCYPLLDSKWTKNARGNPIYGTCSWRC